MATESDDRRSQERLARIHDRAMEISSQIGAVLSDALAQESDVPEEDRLETLALALAHSSAVTLTYEMCCPAHFVECAEKHTKNMLMYGHEFMRMKSEPSPTRH